MKVVKTEHTLYAQLGGTVAVTSDSYFNGLEGESVADLIRRQQKNGDTAHDLAEDLDLLRAEVRLHISRVEYYEDGTHKCVDTAVWIDDE